MLNIGPRADGTIPEEDTNILLEIGKWLEINGEGIYKTTYWKKCGEGPTEIVEGYFTDTKRKPFTQDDFRFTFKDSCLYVFAMKWPEDGVIRIKSLGSNAKYCNSVIKNVEILGYKGEVDYTLCCDYLSINANGIKTDKPVCVKIKID